MAKSDTWIGKKGFRYWYYKFRDSAFYSQTTLLLVVIVCVMLIIYLIIPELNNWFSIRQEVIAANQQITMLQQNINFMNNLDKNQLNQQLEIATEALPAEKDFGSMLGSISNAAAISGMSLDDYSFQVGNINSSAKNTGSDINHVGLAQTQVTVIVEGKISQLKNFIQAIESSLPLAEVTSIQGSDNNISVTIQFYQKPFPSSTFSPEDQLTALSPVQANLLQSLEKWQNENGVQNTPTQTSSSSALPLF